MFVPDTNVGKKFFYIHVFFVVVVIVLGVVYCLRSVYDGEGRHVCVLYLYFVKSFCYISLHFCFRL